MLENYRYLRLATHSIDFRRLIESRTEPIFTYQEQIASSQLYTIVGLTILSAIYSWFLYIDCNRLEMETNKTVWMHQQVLYVQCTRGTYNGSNFCFQTNSNSIDGANKHKLHNCAYSERHTRYAHAHPIPSFLISISISIALQSTFIDTVNLMW